MLVTHIVCLYTAASTLTPSGAAVGVKGCFVPSSPTVTCTIVVGTPGIKLSLDTNNGDLVVSGSFVVMLVSRF